MLEQRERDLHRAGPGVWELGPTGFFVGLNGGFVLGEGEFHPGVCVEVAVGQVVNHLTHRPPFGPVRGVELVRREPLHGGAQMRWCRRDLTYSLLPRRLAGVTVELERPNRIAKVLRTGHVFHATHRYGLGGVRGRPGGVLRPASLLETRNAPPSGSGPVGVPRRSRAAEAAPAPLPPRALP